MGVRIVEAGTIPSRLPPAPEWSPARVRSGGTEGRGVRILDGPGLDRRTLGRDLPSRFIPPDLRTDQKRKWASSAASSQRI